LKGEIVMPLDPLVQKVLDKLASRGKPPLYELTPDQARVEALQQRGAFNFEPPEVAKIQDRKIPGPRGLIPIRFYKPLGAETDHQLPILMYFHGGGYVMGDLESDDPQCRYLANRAKCLVVSVDYRLAPENKFPACVEDVFSATEWVSDNAPQIGGDSKRLAISGQSCGGTLTAVVAQLARTKGGPPLIFQVMFVPNCGRSMDLPSHTLLEKRLVLTRELHDWITKHLLNSEEEKSDPRYCPILADNFSNLPPALIITAEFDPCRDEGRLYADKLLSADVPVEYICYEGQIHPFFAWAGAFPAGKKALDQAAEALRSAFGTST
jgi:acetyl esterase